MVQAVAAATRETAASVVVPTGAAEVTVLGTAVVARARAGRAVAAVTFAWTKRSQQTFERAETVAAPVDLVVQEVVMGTVAVVKEAGRMVAVAEPLET